MSCESHCKECQQEKYRAFSLEEWKRLASLPKQSRIVVFFAWLPVRCPKTKRWVWMERCIRVYETCCRMSYVGWPILKWNLVRIEREKA